MTDAEKRALRAVADAVRRIAAEVSDLSPTVLSDITLVRLRQMEGAVSAVEHEDGSR